MLFQDEAMTYWPFFVYAFIALAVGLVPLYLYHLFQSKKLKIPQASFSSYECGFDPSGDARVLFYSPFYLLAILFVLFDLEMAFLFPWAMLVKQKASLSLLLSGWSFIGILLAGLFYEWKKGVLSCLFSP